jgi:glycosyltransferase involved in cell wall biosynthesis
MENGRIKAWLPAVKAGSGADVFTRRLAATLERHGITAQITWFPLSHELLPSLLRRVQPPSGTDIIIAGSWNGFAFKRDDLPLVVIVHHCVFDPALSPHKSSPQYFYHRYFAEPREVRSLHVSDAVVAVSHCVANHLRQRLGMDDVDVIYNWVDTDVFKPQAREERRDRPFRLLFVGKSSRLKGSDLLAPLMRILGARFELMITANPQDCKKMNLPFNTIPVGRASELEMVHAYQTCDAVLLPSRSEGFGYAALEAMACGKPVIASNNTALPEIVVDNVTGILCDTGDVGAFAKACRRLADNPDICSDMGNKGRQRAVEWFSESVAVKPYLGIINKLVKAREQSKK